MCPMQERIGDISDLTEGEDLAPRQETCPMEGKEKQDEEKLAKGKKYERGEEEEIHPTKRE